MNISKSILLRRSRFTSKACSSLHFVDVQYLEIPLLLIFNHHKHIHPMMYLMSDETNSDGNEKQEHEQTSLSSPPTLYQGIMMIMMLKII